MFLNSMIKELAKESRPKKFTPGDGNCLVEHELSFQHMCGIVEKHFNIRANTLTMFEFLSRIKAIKEDAKAKANVSGLPLPQSS